jgi:hypothetical protein
MWSLWMVASQARARPSDLIGVMDRWAALQFDQAVIWFGTFIENKLQEVHNVGSQDKPKYEPRYTLSDLLSGDLQKEPTAERFMQAFAGFGVIKK